MAFSGLPIGVRRTFVVELAKALGDGWEADTDPKAEADGRDPYCSVGVRHRDGYGVRVDHQQSHNGKPARIELRGEWPRSNDDQVYTPRTYMVGSPAAASITVAADKAIAKIAADIRSRFLPTYLEQWTECKARADQSNDYQKKTQYTLGYLSSAVPGRTSQNSASSYYPKDSEVYQVSAQGDSVRFEAFSCNTRTAIAILKLVQKGPSCETD